MADAGRAMMLYRGLYDSTYTYEKLDVVNHNGSLYISTTDGNLGIEPTDGTKWKLFLQGGVSDNIQATDTYGLVGTKGDSSFVQLLLDSLASRIQGVPLNRQTLGYSKKNLYDNIGNFVSNSYGGVTISRGENDTFNAIGTATDSLNVVQKTFSLPVGKYIISKKISGGVVIAFYNRTKKELTTYNVSTTGTEFEITDENDILDIRLQATPGKVYDMTGQAIMIRSAEITDGTYEPYVDDVDTRLKDVETELGEIPNTYIPKKSILNSQEEIDANTSEENIAGALAVKEISKKMQNEMEASSNWVDITDLCDFGFVDVGSAAVYINYTLRLVSFWVAVNGNVNNQGTVFVIALLPSGSNPKILISSCDHTTDGVSVNLLNDGGTVKSSHSTDVSIANARYSGLIAF